MHINRLRGQWDAAQTQIAVPMRTYLDRAATDILIAVAYLVLGEEGTARTTLENACQLPSPIFFARELQVWFMFDRLPSNPRFDALLEGPSS